MPWRSRPFIGFAPGANGSPARRPSGVLPVWRPYTTLEVMVSTESVCSAFRYDGWRRILAMNDSTRSTAMRSARSSLFP